jgi:hypothetical protein
MGSLMAGWDANPWNAEKVMNRSKTSLTKEEIEAFWRARQLAMEEHLNEAAAQKIACQDETNGGTPTIVIPNAPMEIIEEVHVVPMAMSPDWWTRSNWAFLNEPPEKDMRNTRGKYTAQFDVAAKATTQMT